MDGPSWTGGSALQVDKDVDLKSVLLSIVRLTLDRLGSTPRLSGAMRCEVHPTVDGRDPADAQMGSSLGDLLSTYLCDEDEDPIHPRMDFYI